MFADVLTAEGSVTLDYQDETFHDIFFDNTPKALKISLIKTNTDIGSNPSNPQIEFIMPEVYFQSRNMDRPIDDVVGEELDFKAVYNTSNSQAVEVKVVNETADFAA